MTLLSIDAHHHFWKYSAAEYGWMNDRMAAIRRDFLPANLKQEMSAAGVEGAVSVQARQTLEETRWLLEMASAHSFLKAVVGWVPLTDPKAGEALDRFGDHSKFRAVRHVLQDEADDNYILRPDFNSGIRALQPRGLVYDILIFERHLPQTIRFVDQHPKQVFVLDHIAKPKIGENQVSPWRENLRELAKRPNVYCKLSGMVTEANWQEWTEEQLQPYFQTALEAFGPKRLMFGSDWPVLVLAGTYGGWHHIVLRAISKLSADEQARIRRGTAIEAYGLKV